MGALNFDFVCCPVPLSVEEAVRRCDEVFTLLGARRAVSLKQIVVVDEMMDVDPNTDLRVDTLEQADRAASGWIGREHMYRYPAPNAAADVTLTSWLDRAGCTVVVTIERPDMRALNQGDEPFASMGATCAALSAALGAEWGRMRIDEDLALLSADDFEHWKGSLEQGGGDPALAWVTAGEFAQWPAAQASNPAFRVIHTIDDYRVLLHDQTISWLEANL
jgi:hypothetical protein